MHIVPDNTCAAVLHASVYRQHHLADQTLTDVQDDLGFTFGQSERDVCVHSCCRISPFAMSEQRTLEDVGVKRARQDSDGEKGPKPCSDAQPPSKKTHTESSDPKQVKASEQTKSKENQASTSNVAAKDKQPAKEKAAPEPKEANNTQKQSGQETQQSDPKAEQHADTADAKEPLSSSVPKPEGMLLLKFRHTPAPNLAYSVIVTSTVYGQA